MRFVFRTAGESHGRALIALVEGVPAGLSLVAERDIDPDLQRRQGGYGRGGRMKIEKDRAEFLSGVRLGETLGSPIALAVWNRDWENWRTAMAYEPPAEPLSDEARRRVTLPRPGHADLVGVLKYDRDDARDILERSSARETTMRVAAGGVAKRLLAEAGIDISSVPQPSALEVGTVLRALNVGAGTFEPVLATDVRDIPVARRSFNSTFEMGYRGAFGRGLSLAVDLYHSTLTNVLTPVSAQTPNAFLDEGMLTAYLSSQGIPAQNAADIAAVATRIPLGTVSVRNWCMIWRARLAKCAS